ncbi:hypothetical protein NLI96_g4649 [Meripilus lineatus]|uniref:Uncharacterized protein n=1 Tax=Meripilus lineatus TaxID=2056292 RepID=A0AAD5YJQ4_9APHY|nr:hypothetical protein NLI96_g4649 [Physisporinus lineatus]
MSDASNGPSQERLTIKIPAQVQKNVDLSSDCFEYKAKLRSWKNYEDMDNVASPTKTRERGKQGRPISSQDEAPGSVGTREVLTIKIPSVQKRIELSVLALRHHDKLAEQQSRERIEHTDDVASLPKTNKRVRLDQDEDIGSVTTGAPKAKRLKLEGTYKVHDHCSDVELLDTEQGSKSLGNDAPGKISKGTEMGNHHVQDHDGLSVGDQGNHKQPIGTDFTEAEEPSGNEEINYQGYDQAALPLGNQEDVSKGKESKGKERAHDHDHDGLTIDDQNGEDPSGRQEQDSNQADKSSEYEPFTDPVFQYHDPDYFTHHVYCKKCEKAGSSGWVPTGHVHPMYDGLHSGELSVLPPATASGTSTTVTAQFDSQNSGYNDWIYDQNSADRPLAYYAPQNDSLTMVDAHQERSAQWPDGYFDSAEKTTGELHVEPQEAVVENKNVGEIGDILEWMQWPEDPSDQVDGQHVLYSGW